MNYYWKIGDGRIWSSEKAAFVDGAPESETITPLYKDSEPAGVDYLRETIRFYRYPLGELTTDRDRVAEIDARLDAIDDESARPLRAIIAGTGSDADKARLASLEQEAAGLRKERTALLNKEEK